jgi:hypothetical protein
MSTKNKNTRDASSMRRPLLSSPHFEADLDADNSASIDNHEVRYPSHIFIMTCCCIAASISTLIFLDFYFQNLKNDVSIFKQTFQFTHVEYNPNSIVSLCYAVCTFVPMIILIMSGTFFIARRELETLFGMIGMLVNSFLAAVLKRIFKDPRPIGRYITLKNIVGFECLHRYKCMIVYTFAFRHPIGLT